MAHLVRLSFRLGIKVKIGDEERAYFLNWIEEEGQAFSFGENQVVPGRFIRTIRWKLPKEAARFDDSDPMEHSLRREANTDESPIYKISGKFQGFE